MLKVISSIVLTTIPPTIKHKCAADLAVLKQRLFASCENLADITRKTKNSTAMTRTASNQTNRRYDFRRNHPQTELLFKTQNRFSALQQQDLEMEEDWYEESQPVPYWKSKNQCIKK